MNKGVKYCFAFLILLFSISLPVISSGKDIKLPAPALKGLVSVEESIYSRRSVRSYSSEALTLEQVSQLLWAGQGITGKRFRRAAPSAGALYPLEIYLAVKSDGVNGLDAGAYRYIPSSHALSETRETETNGLIASAAYTQMWMSQAPVMVIVAADFSRTQAKYGGRGTRYVYIEAGLAAENLMLQAQALGLSSCPVGAFKDRELNDLAGIPDSQQALLIITVGHKGK